MFGSIFMKPILNKQYIHIYKNLKMNKTLNHYFFCLLFFCSSSHSFLSAQNKTTKQNTSENIVIKNEDSNSLQNIIDSYYNCISGPIGEVRDFERLKSLFHPQARLIYSYWDEDINDAKLMIFTPDEFIPKLDYLDKKGFYEYEVSNKIHSFGSVHQVFSTYEFRTEDKSISGRGITSYEVFFDGTRYWIMSMFWTMENDKYQIPKQYLENK